MRDTFFDKTNCDRCGKSLNGMRTMSMYNKDCICMKCSKAEKQRPDYKDAVEADHAEIRKGNYNFKGIGYTKEEKPIKKLQPLLEYIKQNPECNFDLCTPKGYIYLTAETAKRLVSGESVDGQLEYSDSHKKVNAEEIIKHYVLGRLNTEKENELHIMTCLEPEA